MSFHVMNVHVGKMLIGSHAQERWRERSDNRCIKASLERAIPFGGQYGDNLLLIDDDIVFATEKMGRVYLVKTILTKEQAVANMEFASHRRVFNETDRITTPDKIPAIEKSAYEGGLVDTMEVVEGDENRWLISSKKIPKKPKSIDESYYLLMMDMTDFQLHEEMKKSKGTRFACLQREHGIRKRIKSAKDHANKMQSNLAALKKALREILPLEVMQRIWHREQEIRDGTAINQ